MTYPGGKNADGTFQRIVNQIPPHSIYIEGCVGSGAILRAKRPAIQSYAIDKSRSALVALATCGIPNLSLVCADFITWLGKFKWRGGEFVYVDPPYVGSTKGYRRYYQFEMPDSQQRRLLAVLVACPAMVMISGYDCPLYNKALKGWRRLEFDAWTNTRQRRREVLWMNFPAPAELHDHQYAGGNYRERWRIKKKIRRWTRNLVAMEPGERAALYNALVAVMGERGEALPASKARSAIVGAGRG